MRAVTATRHVPAHRSRNAEHSREAILNAAVREFAQEGVAGARTDEIAHAAGVNKALLYYYFKDKEGLYGAVLDFTFTGLREQRVSDSRLRPERRREDRALRLRILRLSRASRLSCRAWFSWR